ncbi:MAG: hypothetical protein ACKOVB_16130 [Terrabacter sp.]
MDTGQSHAVDGVVVQPVSGPSARPLRRGDLARVRSAHEILGTLDAAGDLDRMPFMPEMLPFLGQVHRVSARADKTCDTVDLTGTSREMEKTVHLTELRCDGSAHGGCQAGCLLFFKEDWLAPAPDADAEAPAPAPGEVEEAAREQLRRLAEAHTSPAPGVWRCQATAVPKASRPLTGRHHYLRDITTRNVAPRTFLRAMAINFFDRYQAFSRHRLPRWAWLLGGEEQPVVRGTLSRTPTISLDLRPGEIVEVRSREEINATLDTKQRNRNLWFDREMVRYCGRRFRVVRRVDRLLDEKTGRMIHTKTPSVILDGAVCVGDFHQLCPRQDYAFFREIWLKRPDPEPGEATRPTGDAR